MMHPGGEGTGLGGQGCLLSSRAAGQAGGRGLTQLPSQHPLSEDKREFSSLW